MESKLDRLKIFQDFIGLSNNAFAIKSGLNPSNYAKMVKGSLSFTHRSIAMIGDAFPQLNTMWLLTGEGNMLKEYASPDNDEDMEEGYLVPLVPISVMAGELSTIDTEGVNSWECERILSPIKGIDMAFPVLGDSMEPEYPNGSKVFVKKINHFDFIPYGNVFVLDTTNGPLLKQVKKSQEEDCILCVSLNEAAGYEPFDVPLRTVRAMYRVIMCLSLKG